MTFSAEKKGVNEKHMKINEIQLLDVKLETIENIELKVLEIELKPIAIDLDD